MKSRKDYKSIAIYQTKSGALEIKSDKEHSTIWATQSDIVKIFEIDQSVVSRHIRNIFRDKELDRKSNMQKMHIANSDKPVNFYSLDIILAVGYRANSNRAIWFRRWATKILNSYIKDKYVIDRKRISKNYQQFLKAVGDTKKLLPKGSKINTEDVLELISLFANTWLSLDAYDKGELKARGDTRKKVILTSELLLKNLAKLKISLIKEAQASNLFALERSRGSVQGIVGNIMQTFSGHDLYISIEEKAAHFGSMFEEFSVVGFYTSRLKLNNKMSLVYLGFFY